MLQPGQKLTIEVMTDDFEVDGGDFEGNCHILHLKDQPEGEIVLEEGDALCLVAKSKARSKSRASVKSNPNKRTVRVLVTPR